MRHLNRYLGFEILAIHLLTGALFAVINIVLFAVVMERNAWFVAALVPIAAFSWWGWRAEATFVARVSRELRRAGAPR